MRPRRHSAASRIVLSGIAAIAAALVLALVGGFGGSGGAPPGGLDNIVDNGGSIEIATASFPTGRDTDEVSATGAKPIRPCRLVPKKAAEGILGAGVTVTERPQGPTCVYAGSGREIDLVIEKVSLRALRDSAAGVTPVTIRGRAGWCLRYQESAVVIGIGSGRVLQVTGPCQAGVHFAAVALPRIKRAR